MNGRLGTHPTFQRLSNQPSSPAISLTLHYACSSYSDLCNPRRDGCICVCHGSPTSTLWSDCLCCFECYSTVTVVNHCGSNIAPAFYPAANNGALGGFRLASGASQAVTFPDGYSGRIWGRTGCNAAGVCTSGNCNGGINCTSPAAAGPTLAQFTMNGYAILKASGSAVLTGP
jgi:hypothetical protein